MTVIDIPQRVSLVSQTERVLTEGIARSRWKIRLPAERRLCNELQVSRGTLRAAIGGLVARKLIRVRPGQPGEILVQPGGRGRYGPRTLRIGCLLPDPLMRLPAFVVLWIDDLRARLQRMGAQLDLYHGSRFYAPDGAGRLADLVARNPHNCWVLLLSNAGMQRWFQEKGVPTVVAGSLHEGIRLPSVDIDFRAVGRHACGMMFARGHRKIAMIASNRSAGGVGPGIIEMEKGLREAFAAGRHSESELSVVHHDGKPADVCAAVDRLLRLPKPPTALLIVHSNTLLSAITHLAQRQLVVPRDLSIIVSHDEPFYGDIVPELTHYEWNPDKFALHIRRVIERALQRSNVPSPCVRLMPRLIAGRTLAARAAAERAPNSPRGR